MSEDTCTVCGRRSARLHDLVVCAHHLRRRLAAAEAEVVRLRGQRDSALREAAALAREHGATALSYRLFDLAAAAKGGPMVDRCIVCDCEVPADWSAMCDACEDLAIRAEASDSWLVALGTAIRRFVRDAEVARLTEEAKLATRHARPCVAHADPDAEVCGCDVRRSRDAIDRLAALAKEGTTTARRLTDHMRRVRGGRVYREAMSK